MNCQRTSLGEGGWAVFASVYFEQKLLAGVGKKRTSEEKQGGSQNHKIRFNRRSRREGGGGQKLAELSATPKTKSTEEAPGVEPHWLNEATRPRREKKKTGNGVIT